MADSVPPIPYKSQVLDESGFLTQPWSKWFLLLFNRIGGTEASSNTDLDSRISTLSTEVTTQGATISAQAAEIADIQADIEGLQQGRTL